ncbi:MAG: hypothetical protein ACI4V3_05235 [Faecousia sp.]
MNGVNKPGIYALVLGSRKQVAKAFNMKRDEYKHMNDLFKKGKCIEYCEYYEKPLKVLTEDDVNHCRTYGELCSTCDGVSYVVKGYEPLDWEDDWNRLWEELNK